MIGIQCVDSHREPYKWPWPPLFTRTRNLASNLAVFDRLSPVSASSLSPTFYSEKLHFPVSDLYLEGFLGVSLDVSMKNGGVLLLTEEEVPLHVAAVVPALNDAAKDVVISEDDLVVTTLSRLLGGKLPILPGSLDFVVAIWKKPESVLEQCIEEIGKVLKPGGKILVQVVPSSVDQGSSTLERKLLMQGFLEVREIKMKALLPLEDFSFVTVEGKKASWMTGSSFPLKKATNTIAKIQVDYDIDLIDEDTLLTEEDLTKPKLPTFEDCKVESTRKACKNCTCGRAEAENKGKLGLTVEQINNPQSACGNCGLGDAFRCGGCPYRGLPPFNLGEKIYNQNRVAFDRPHKYLLVGLVFMGWVMRQASFI